MAYRPVGVAEGAAVPIGHPGAGVACRQDGEGPEDLPRRRARAWSFRNRTARPGSRSPASSARADGTPRELTAPITLATGSDPDQGVWVNDTTVAVMKGSAAANVTPELLSLTSGQPQQLAPWPGLVCAQRRQRAEEIYGQSAEGIFQRLGNGWSPQLKGPLRSSFPG